MKVADPRAAVRHIYICDFCGQSSLGTRGPESPALVVADNGESCICGTCAAKAVEVSAKSDATPAQEPGHA